MAKLRYGIMGGTFNPIHYAHLFIANEVLEMFNLDKVIFIPTGISPHKKDSGIDVYHRLSMAKLAIKGNPNFLVSEIEVLNLDTSYSVDTMTMLKREHPNIEFYFIVGTDTIMEMKNWKNPGELMNLCNLVCVNRPGYEGEAQDSMDELTEEYGAKIYSLNGPSLFISSTLIRNRVKENRTIKYLLPDNVLEYIDKNRLYQDQVQKKINVIK